MASESRVGAHEVRSRFLSFFEAREHRVVPSSPLVPANDPTLLFTNAGMVQFKDVFTGREKRSYSRATSSQRCLRAGGKHNDLDNVGFTPRHHTFFEMLGNFSFGDYFKADAIKWAWEFLTGELGIAGERLVVSVFDGRGEDVPFDQEAYDLWAEIVPAERIYKCPAKENFWQMGDTGPCGPCSEIHLFRPGVAPPHAGVEGRGPEFEDSTYLELWNLVFMQYEKHESGEMTQLPRPSIDTGAGLERVAAVLAGVESNYGTELLSPMVDRAKALAGVSGPQGDRESPFQVIADHARATAFLISDGVFPDRAGRSYVLRRIMRRAIRYGTSVGLDKPFFHEVCAEVIDRFEDAYPELRRASATIAEVVKTEEAAFRRTLDRGLRRLEGELDALDEEAKVFPVTVAAELYDTFGFPIDLTGVIAREHELSLDEDEVEAEVHRRQAQGQSFAGQDDAVGDVYFEVERRLAEADRTPEFSGYVTESEDSVTLWAIVRDGVVVDEAGAGDEVGLVFSSTPMYAESGGQVGDRGTVRGAGVVVHLDDVRKPTGGAHVHFGRVESGTLRVDEHYALELDSERRDAIRRNHSATHLLHHALREVLGDHVIQKGSLVAPDRLRFDFSHGKALTRDQRVEIERRVNAEILANEASATREMQLDEAKSAGAIGLFGEKYDDEVRVVSIGRESVELCGGTHVHRAGDIGSFALISEGGIAQGVRRVEAVTGMGAVEYSQSLAAVVAGASSALHAGSLDQVLDKLDRLQRDLKARGAEVRELKRQLATGAGAGEDTVVEVQGIKLLVKRVSVADPKTMRGAADTLRDRLGSGVVVLGGEREGKANLLVAVTKDLTDRVHAGKLAGVLAAAIDGRGGGRPELAQAGGANVAALDATLAGAAEALGAQLG